MTGRRRYNSCIIKACPFNGKKGDLESRYWIPFFRIPSNKERQRRWCDILGIRSPSNLDMCKVCSSHFTDDSFTDNKKLRLKATAVPNKSLPTVDTKYTNESPIFQEKDVLILKQKLILPNQVLTQELTDPTSCTVNKKTLPIRFSKPSKPVLLLPKPQVYPQSLQPTGNINYSTIINDGNTFVLSGNSGSFTMNRPILPKSDFVTQKTLANASKPQSRERTNQYSLINKSASSKFSVNQNTIPTNNNEPSNYYAGQQQSNNSTPFIYASQIFQQPVFHLGTKFPDPAEYEMCFSSVPDKTTTTDVGCDEFSEQLLSASDTESTVESPEIRNCIICHNNEQDKFSRVDKANNSDMIVFVNDILHLGHFTPGKISKKFQFCKNCFDRMKTLRDLYKDINVLQQQFNSMKMNVMEGIVKVYLQRHTEFNSSPDAIVPGWTKAKATESILNRWIKLSDEIRNKGRSFDNSPKLLDRSTQTTATEEENVLGNIELANILSQGSEFNFSVENGDYLQSHGSVVLEAGSPNDLNENEIDRIEIVVGSLQEICENLGTGAALDIQVMETNKSEISNVPVTATDDEITGDDSGASSPTQSTAEPKIKIPTWKKYAKKIIICPVCSKRMSRSAFWSHMNTHTGARPYQCDECSKRFRQRPHLQAHVKGVHGETKNRMYHCGLCTTKSQSFHKGKGLFTRHLKLYHYTKGEVVVKQDFWFHFCDAVNCNMSFPDHESLRHHLLEDHSSNCILGQCETCQRCFASPDGLEDHKRSHFVLVPTSDNEGIFCVFGCEYCQQVFTSENELNSHKPVHHVRFDVAQYVHLCEECGKKFASYRGLYQHRWKVHKAVGEISFTKKSATTAKPSTQIGENRVPKKYICQVCSKSCHSANLKKHMYRHTHPDGFPCSDCDHKAANPWALQYHKIDVHQLKTDDYRLVKHTCSYCNQMFSTRGSLYFQKHLIKFHPNEYLKGRQYCFACFKIFDTTEEVDNHYIEKHANLICVEKDCLKKFRNKHAFNLHQNIHKNLRPFQCTFCEMKFNHESTLQSHTNAKHTFHRSYFCKLCPHNPGYYEKRGLSKHAQREHVGLPEEEIFIFKYPKKKFVPRMPPIIKPTNIHVDREVCLEPTFKAC